MTTTRSFSAQNSCSCLDLLKTERFQDAPQRQTHGEAQSYAEQKCNIVHKKLFLNNSEVVPS